MVGTGCTGRAPACPHATAKQSRVAATKRWSTSSAQRPPAAHGAQIAVTLCCVRAGWAVSGSGACSVVVVAPSSMASTARMGLKPASHGSHHWPPRGAHTPTSPMDGRAAPMAGPLSRPRAAASELADAIRGQPQMRAGHEQVASAELVERWRTRGAGCPLPRDATGSERFVADSRQKLVELPVLYRRLTR